jgi:Zn-dependent M28 family amino/carboxypeptidase
MAVLPGEGFLAQEVIVIGAHYDHVGRGGPGSGAIDPNSKEIHNGADDNASGAATLVEVARQLSQSGRKPRRTIVFIAFTGEERGLFGSDYYVKNPLFKLEDTVAMLNMDMVGRLDDEKLIVEGVGTGEGFEPLVERINGRYGFKLTKKPGGFGPSDHASFYGKKIPVMHFFTGTHKDYHRPTDDFEKLNVSGMRRVGEMVAEIALHVAEAAERPKYLETASTQRLGGGGDRPYFGSIPDFAQEQPGYAITGVAKDSPAAKGGLQGGDVIVKFGESRIGNLEDFDSALRKYKGGDRVPVVVKRDGKEVTLQVTLGEPRG